MSDFWKEEEDYKIFGPEHESSLQKTDFYDVKIFPPYSKEDKRLICPVEYALAIGDSEFELPESKTFGKVLFINKESDRSMSLVIDRKKKDISSLQKQYLIGKLPRFQIQIFDTLALDGSVIYPFSELLNFQSNPKTPTVIELSLKSDERLRIEFLRHRDTLFFLHLLDKYASLLKIKHLLDASSEEAENSKPQEKVKRKGVGTNKAIQSTYSLRKLKTTSNGIFHRVPVTNWKSKQIISYFDRIYVRIIDPKEDENGETVKEEIFSVRLCFEMLKLMKSIIKYLEKKNANLFTLRDQLIGIVVKFDDEDDPKKKKKKKRKPEEYIPVYNIDDRRNTPNFELEELLKSKIDVKTPIGQILGFDIATSDVLRQTLRRMIISINILECLEVHPSCPPYFSKPFFKQYLKILECRKDFNESFWKIRRGGGVNIEKSKFGKIPKPGEYVEKDVLHHHLQNLWVTDIKIQNIGRSDIFEVSERYLMSQMWLWDEDECALTLKLMMLIGYPLNDIHTQEILCNKFYKWIFKNIGKLEKLNKRNEKLPNRFKSLLPDENQTFKNSDFIIFVDQFCSSVESKKKATEEVEDFDLLKKSEILKKNVIQELIEDVENKKKLEKFDILNLSFLFRKFYARFKYLSDIESLLGEIEKLDLQIHTIRSQPLEETLGNLAELGRADLVMQKELSEETEQDSIENLKSELRQINFEKEKNIGQVAQLERKMELLENQGKKILEEKVKPMLEQLEKYKSYLANSAKKQTSEFNHDHWLFLRSPFRREAYSYLVRETMKDIWDEEISVSLRLDYFKGHSYYISFDLGKFIRFSWIDGGFVVFKNKQRIEKEKIFFEFENKKSTEEEGEEEDDDEKEDDWISKNYTKSILEPIFSTQLEFGILKDSQFDEYIEELSHILVKYNSIYDFAPLGLKSLEKLDEERRKKQDIEIALKLNKKKKTKKVKKKKGKFDHLKIPAWKTKKKKSKTPIDFLGDISNALNLPPLQNTILSVLSAVRIYPVPTTLSEEFEYFSMISRNVRFVDLKEQFAFGKRYKSVVERFFSVYKSSVVSTNEEKKVFFNSHAELDLFVSLIIHHDQEMSESGDEEEMYFKLKHDDIFTLLRAFDDSFWEIHKIEKGRSGDACPDVEGCPFLMME